MTARHSTLPVPPPVVAQRDGDAGARIPAAPAPRVAPASAPVARSPLRPAVFSPLPGRTLPSRRQVMDARQARGCLGTVRDLVRYATSRLQQAEVHFGQGSRDAYGEAIWLVCHVLHLPFEPYEALADARVGPSEVDAVLSLLERRCSSHAPLAYLTGEAWLRGWRFLCDERALVPRSLIVEAIDQESSLYSLLPQNEYGQPRIERVLDLCCGGGSIGIIAAHLFGQAHVTGVDLSADALDLARSNARLHFGDAAESRFTWLQGDLLEPLRDSQAAGFDLILCNPPYVNRTTMDRLPREFQAEPQGALAGGDDGMDLIERILAGAARHLSPDGVLVLEIGHEAVHFQGRYAETLAWHWIPVTAGQDQVLAIEAGGLPIPAS